MDKIRNVTQWVLFSSVNSDKVSLTLKAGIPLLVLWGVSDTETLENLTGAIGQLVVQAGQMVTGVVTIYGLLRKLWFTFR